MPVEAQRRLAAGLWQNVRQLLLAAEQALRNGAMEQSQLAELGRALLAAAAISLATAPEDSQAAMRALLRLSAGHPAALHASVADALPLLLWLADALGATGRRNPGRPGGIEALARELLEELLQAAAAGALPDLAAQVLSAALLRSPPEALEVANEVAEPLGKSKAEQDCIPLILLRLLHQVYRTVAGQQALKAVKYPLRHWLEQCQQARAHLEVTRLLDDLLSSSGNLL